MCRCPGADGFSLLERLEPPLPAVIFTTAYDEFAVKAFEFNALDYLLKPWTRTGSWLRSNDCGSARLSRRPTARRPPRRGWR